jgi:NADH:ubiquinone oxidoreductase subunit
MFSLKLLTWIKGRFVGEDAYGNRYYRERFLFAKPNRRLKRWVVYKGEAEASKVPSEWYGWLHFTYEEPLLHHQPKGWEKPHQPNLTGTENAYFPKLSWQHNKEKNTKKTLSYEPWNPKVTKIYENKSPLKKKRT